jgi:hypothetical protein
MAKKVVEKAKEATPAEKNYAEMLYVEKKHDSTGYC